MCMHGCVREHNVHGCGECVWVGVCGCMCTAGCWCGSHSGGRRGVRRKAPSVERTFLGLLRVDKAAPAGWFLGVRERPLYLHTVAAEHGGVAGGWD